MIFPYLDRLLSAHIVVDRHLETGRFRAQIKLKLSHHLNTIVDGGRVVTIAVTIGGLRDQVSPVEAGCVTLLDHLILTNQITSVGCK